MGRPSTLTGWWRDLLTEVGGDGGITTLSEKLGVNPRTINRWCKGELQMRTGQQNRILAIAGPELMSRPDCPIGKPNKTTIKIFRSALNNNEGDDSMIDFDEGDTVESIPYNPDRKIFTQKNEYSIEYLHKLAKRGRLNLQPTFQRRFVWDIEKASALIESILLDMPIPVIYLAEDPDSILAVVDGQQRLSAIFSFIDGTFPEMKSFNLSKLRILSELNGKNYQQIPLEFQEKIDSSSLSVITIKNESDVELKFEIFERLNTGSVALNDQELRNCLYRGSYLDLAKELASDHDYAHIMGFKGPEKRMKDVEYVIRFGAFYHQTYLKYSSSMKSFINQEMAKNKNISNGDAEKLRDAFKKAIQINKSLFGARSFRKITRGTANDPNIVWKNSKIVNGALYDLMMVSLLKYDKNLIYRNLDAIREAYISLLTENDTFIDAVEKWTNDKNQTKARFEIFSKLLDDIFESDTSQSRCFSAEIKDSLFRINNKCELCGQRILAVEDAAVDHVEQFWLGGKTVPENARITHRYCNQARKRLD